jgi:hypothetical protein
VLLLARRIGAYPFFGKEVDRLSQLPAVRDLPGGLTAVRVTPEATERPRDLRPGWGRGRGGVCRLGPERCEPSDRRGRGWRRRAHGDATGSGSSTPATLGLSSIP